MAARKHSILALRQRTTSGELLYREETPQYDATSVCTLVWGYGETDRGVQEELHTTVYKARAMEGVVAWVWWARLGDTNTDLRGQTAV